MGDLVSDGTGFQCNLCTGQLKISVISSSGEGDSKKLAADTNFIFPPPAGAQCLLIPNAPAPCAPPKVSVLAPGQSAVEIDGKKALGAGCSLQCAKGGMLSVASSAQSSAQHDGAQAGKKLALAALVATSPIFVPLEAQQELIHNNRTSRTTPPNPQRSSNPPPRSELPPPPPPPPPEEKGWHLPPKGGATINGRWYSEHALERMAPKTPEMRAVLEQRAIEKAQKKGLKFQTEEFATWWKNNRPDPRGIPPSVVEAEIANPGSTGIKVVLSDSGRVITVIPGGP